MIECYTIVNFTISCTVFSGLKIFLFQPIFLTSLIIMYFTLMSELPHTLDTLIIFLLVFECFEVSDHLRMTQDSSR